MTRKWILLNLLLIALAASLVYLLRQHYREAQAHERAIFERAAQAKAVPPPPPLTPPAPVTAMQYFDVAQRNLFSSDRNPNVIIPPPPPPPAEKPMPALPAYFGQIGIGEPTVLLKPGPNDPQKRYHVGEKIGPFELVSFDQEKIKFKWNDKDVERRLSELTPKEAPPDLTQSVAAAPPQTPSGPRISTIGPSSSDSSSRPDSQVGADIGGGFRACVTGDNSPSGTVVNGYRKAVTKSMMGNSCKWEPVQK